MPRASKPPCSGALIRGAVPTAAGAGAGPLARWGRWGRRLARRLLVRSDRPLGTAGVACRAAGGAGRGAVVINLLPLTPARGLLDRRRWPRCARRRLVNLAAAHVVDRPTCSAARRRPPPPCGAGRLPQNRWPSRAPVLAASAGERAAACRPRRPTAQPRAGGAGQPAGACAPGRRWRIWWTAPRLLRRAATVPPRGGDARAHHTGALPAPRRAARSASSAPGGAGLPGIEGQSGWRRPLDPSRRRLAASTRAAMPLSVEQRHGALEQALLDAPDAVLAQRHRQRLAAAHCIAHAPGRGCPRPASVHQHRGLAFSRRPSSMRSARALAGQQHGFAELGTS